MDTDRQADEAWILGVQRKLYQWSQAYPDDAWRDMWGWLTDTRMFRHAWRRVASNRGARSARIEGFFAKDEFRYDPDADAYVCPAGAHLDSRYEGKVRDLKRVDYRNPLACAACQL